MNRLASTAAAGCLALLTACGPGYQDLPLPGSGVDGPSYRIEAAFTDAVNLSDGARVKVGGLPVGRVAGVRAEGFQAIADLDIQRDVQLPQGTTARLRYDTPLGEVFVELTTPDSGAPLAEGAAIPVADTNTAPSVEDTLAQASLLINGGGLTELQTITEELNAAFGGREQTTRDMMHRQLALLRGLNSGSRDLDVVLRELSKVGKVLAGRREVFARAIKSLGPLADVLREDTPQLDRLVSKSAAVTRRANHVMSLTEAQLSQLLTQLGPILAEILAAEPELIDGYRALAMADDVIGDMIPGDFIGLDALIRLDLSGLAGMGGAGATTVDPGSDSDSTSDGLLSGVEDLIGSLLGRQSAQSSSTGAAR